jgi:GntR family transcriptional regulator
VNVEVDVTSPTPPYEQIRSQVATMIAAGALGPGTHLPPIRQLAADLGLAANTVARAYRELEATGLVVSRVRHGTVVAARVAALPADEIRRRLDEAAAAYVAIAINLGIAPEQVQDAVRGALDDRETARQGIDGRPA